MYLPVCSPGIGCIYYGRPHLQPCGFKEWENGRWCCTKTNKSPSKPAPKPDNRESYYVDGPSGPCMFYKEEKWDSHIIDKSSKNSGNMWC